MLTALRRRREAKPAEPGVPSGVHEHEEDEKRGDEDVEDRYDLKHAVRIAAPRCCYGGEMEAPLANENA